MPQGSTVVELKPRPVASVAQSSSLSTAGDAEHLRRCCSQRLWTLASRCESCGYWRLPGKAVPAAAASAPGKWAAQREQAADLLQQVRVVPAINLWRGLAWAEKQPVAAQQIQQQQLQQQQANKTSNQPTAGCLSCVLCNGAQGPAL